MTDETRWMIDSIAARLERTIKRLWIMCLVLIILLVGSNIAWLIYESQWQYVSTDTEIQQEVEQEIDGIGNNTFVGGDYGSETDSTDNRKK